MAEVEKNVTNFPIKVGPIPASAANAEKARIWAEGTDQEVATLDGVHSAKGWAEVSEAMAVGAEWGKIVGTLSDQTDLKDSLDGKQDVISDLDKHLKNNTTQTNGLAIIGTVTDQAGVSVGESSTASRAGVAIGRRAESKNYGVAIGGTDGNSTKTYANASSVAIGYGANCTGSNAAQIGLGTNATGGTLQFQDYQLLDASGKVPTARLTTMTGADGANAGTAGIIPAPAATDNTKYLKGDGTWAAVDSLPSQTGNSGKFLTTNGTTASWATVSSYPTLTWYTGNTGATVTIADTSSADLVKVYKNGILLEPTADYSISGTTLTLVTALESTDKITIEVFS